MSFWIFLSAFLIRVAVQYKLGAFIAPHMLEYETVANNFLAGRGLVYDTYGTTYYSLIAPLYPLLCILVYSLSGHSFFIMSLVQALISSATCVVVFWIGKRIFGYKAGLIAAILTVFHPGFVVYASKFHSFCVDSFLFCLIVWLLIVVREKPDFLNQLKLGMAYGLTLLTRATSLLFLPFSWVWLKKKLKRVFPVYILISFMLLAPWLIRNYIIYKKFIMLSSTANVFWRGNNPLATGTSLAKSGKPMLEEAKDTMSLIDGRSEMEQNRIFWNESFKFIRNNPLKFVKLTLRKFYYFWWFAPTAGSEYKREWLELYIVFYSIIIMFSIFGFIGLKSITAQSRYDVYIIILFMLIIAVTQSLFYVETRHRWAIEPLLLIFAAKGMVSAEEKIRKCLKTKT